jgi:hypothetical protein
VNSAAGRGGDWRQAAGWLLAAILLAVIVFGYLMPLTAYFTAVPGDLGDVRYNAWALEHLYRVLMGHHQAGLWNPDHYYPFQGALAFSDSHFGSGASYVVARLLGLPREHAFNAWFITGTLLNFASAMYMLRRLGFSVAASALGAFFFTFALPVSAKDGHAQLVHRFPAPLAVLALWQMFERRRVADLARVAFFTVWQFYCSIYLGLFLAYLLAALAAGIVLARRPLGGWEQWRANLLAESDRMRWTTAAVFAVSVLALGYLGAGYLLISRQYGVTDGWTIEYITQLLPRPVSYLIADGTPLLDWLTYGIYVPMRHEHNLFIGFGALALVFTAMLGRRKTADPHLTLAMLIALALLIAGTLLIGFVSFYYLIAWLPGVSAIRCVSRIILIMLIPVSVLVAAAADLIWFRFGRSAAAGAAVLAGLTVLLATEPLTFIPNNSPIVEWRKRLDAVKARLPGTLPQDAILLVRSGSPKELMQVYTELDAMLIGQDLDRPVLNGASPFAPPGYRLLRCVPVEERLESYSRFIGGGDVSAYRRRLVVVDLSPCPQP